KGKVPIMAVRSQALAMAVIGLTASLRMMPAANAQELPLESWSSDNITTENDGMRETGRTAETGIGEVGQRQSSKDVGAHVEPMGRIDGRVQNRVQNRLRNRIDRTYNPRANATSPFEVASDQARRTARPRSR